MQEVQVPSLGWEDPLEKEMATHSSVLAWEIHGQRSLAGYSPWGCKESDTHTLTVAGRASSWSLAAGPRDPHTHLGSLVGRMVIS